MNDADNAQASAELFNFLEGVAMTDFAQVDREALGNAILEYGQAQYQAGVAQSPAYTVEEHAARIAEVSARFSDVLDICYPTRIATRRTTEGK